MTQVVLQPCGEGLPAQHYLDTVEQLVSLDQIAEFVGETDLRNLRSIFREEGAAAWGVTPGKRSAGASKWERMQTGDVALFSRKGKIFSAGTVVYKIHNPELARALWAEDEEGQTWEYMYFLKDLRQLDISYEIFNLAAGYNPKNVIQGFSVLADAKSKKVLELIDIQSAASSQEKELEEIRALNSETEDFDPKSETEGRKKALASICRRQGQPEFRRKLIAAYGGRCAITGCDAIQTLEAAHIIPYDGPKTNHPANGILLRSDLHILFDLGLLSINPSTYEVRLSSRLLNSSYAEFHGKKLFVPVESMLCPNTEALAEHAKTCVP